MNCNHFKVRLHMLQELEEYITPMMSSGRKAGRHSIESWRARFSLTQVSETQFRMELKVVHACLYVFDLCISLMHRNRFAYKSQY